MTERQGWLAAQGGVGPVGLGAVEQAGAERVTLSLEQHYAALERRFPPSDGADYERLVVPQGNADEPVHRWFHMKEAFSPLLLPRLVKDLDLAGRAALRVHDPFLGSGTTLTSGLLLADGPVVSGSGSEINPFLALLAGTKVGCLSLGVDERAAFVVELAAAAAGVVAAAASGRGRAPAAPALATFADARYFPSKRRAALLRMRAAWQGLQPGLVRDVVGVALASCLEPCSRLRRDGRALRYEQDKVPEDPVRRFEGRVEEICDDLARVAPRGSARVVRGSALEPGSWGAGLDLVCFSPPYPNNIDYTEVYKLEAWFLDLIVDVESFRGQRRKTMRSHPSVVFPERFASEQVPLGVLAAACKMAAPVLAAVPADRYQRQRERTIAGYLQDSAVLFWRAREALVDGGLLVYVVGNSRHGSGDGQFTIASDVLLAGVASEIGFEVVDVKAARTLHRRGRHEHLRESVVVLRKAAS